MDVAHWAAQQRTTGRVGMQARTVIWRETFQVRAGENEAVYANMPAFGLRKAANAVLAADLVAPATDCVDSLEPRNHEPRDVFSGSVHDRWRPAVKGSTP